jgi:hypothetical protein
MKAKTLCSTFIAAAMLTVAPLELSAKTLGMVADNRTNSVTVFDADTHAVLGTVFITSGFFLAGDVGITPDLKRGFVTNFPSEVFVIDLTTSPPRLAGGTNPIPVSNSSQDLSISPDGKFLVVASGSEEPQPISVIDIAAQAEISTLSTGENTTSVEVCSDSSVLVTSLDGVGVRRLTLSAAGTLADTGEVFSVGFFSNVYCAPGAQSGVVVSGGTITSFTIPGLVGVDTRPLSGTQTYAGTINRAGNRVFARSNDPGSIDVFDFDSDTGALGESPLLTIPVGELLNVVGLEQIALHPNGTKLFVSEPSAVNVYNPRTGALLGSITDPNIVTPNGVTVVKKKKIKK